MPPEIIALLRRTGLCGPAETPRGEALAGGVSSDIWRVDLAGGPVCVKRALPRLRVAQLWQAPIERNRYEYEWFRAAGTAVPGSVPRVIAHEEGAFVLKHSNQIREFLITPEGIRLEEVYVGPEGVLTGSMRAAQEDREKAEAQARGQEIERKQRELARKRAALEAQIAALRTEFEAVEEESKVVAEQDRAREQQLSENRNAAAIRRGADAAKRNRK